MINKFTDFDDSVDGINEDYQPESMNLRQILNDGFIKKHSECNSIEEILAKCGEGIDIEKIASYPQEKLNAVISTCTDFSSWSEMYSEAIQEHLM